MRGFGDIAERLRRSTVQIFNGHRQDARSQGSGIVWNAGGLILTNAHVARTPEAEIELWDGRRFHARVASRDPRRDLATLRIVVNDGALEPATPGRFHIATPRRTRDRGRQSAGIRRRAFHRRGALHRRAARHGRAELDSRRRTPGPGQFRRTAGQRRGPRDRHQHRHRQRPRRGGSLPHGARFPAPRRAPLRSASCCVRWIWACCSLEVDRAGAAANASLLPGDILLTRYDALTTALDSGRPTLRLHFLRGDRTRVREAVVRLADAVEAAA